MMPAPAREECPDENALAELVQGLLEPLEANRVEAHLDGCAECRRIVSCVGQSSYVAERVARRATPAPESTWLMFGPNRTLPDARRDETAAPAIGKILAGKYQIERLLGQGGMGVVMAAKHLALGKLVAIKVMRPEVLVEPSAAQRFVREARAASRLRSEHIVRVIDLDTIDGGVPFIAMEYLEGEDLGALVQRGPIDACEAVTYVLQVCEAIAEAHAAGIVHRDLKPANLFVTRRSDGSPCMKVLDFGVSKIIAGGPLADELTSTDTKALVGSPSYMAPEQLISAKAVDPRTDIWALGCILFELVIGRTPFGANPALAQVLASILRDETPRMQVLRADLPVGFAEVVERCLEKDPSRRYPSVDALAAALSPFISTAAPIVNSPATAALAIRSTPSTPPRRPRRPARVAIVAIATAAALGTGFYATMRSSTEGTAAATMAPTVAPAATPSPMIIPAIATPPPAAVAPPPTTTPPSVAPVGPSAGPSHRRKSGPSPAPHRGRPLEDDLLPPQL